MGIQGLTKVIGDHAPGALKTREIKSYFGRKVAVDASMSIYQFLIAVRSEGNQLTNADGETTSHLSGLFYRTLRMMDNGIKPVYVFDGAPPTLKSGELAKRLERRQVAQDGLRQAQESGDAEALDKFSRRTVKVTRQHNDDCKKLLTLMGVPYVDAPCEAEAQCAALCKSGHVYGAGSEDMDTLTFGSPVLLRHLTFSEMRKEPIMEINLQAVLSGLQFTMDQFIDLCILLGCDYCDSIRGIGPKRAVDLIKEYKNLEAVVVSLDTEKYPVPEDWPFVEARRLFKEPLVNVQDAQFKWLPPQEDALIEFMCSQNQFSEDRIRKGIEKLKKTRTGSVQQRLDGFFTVVPCAKEPKKKPASKKGVTSKVPFKRKVEASAEPKSNTKKAKKDPEQPAIKAPVKKKEKNDDFVVPDGYVSDGNDSNIESGSTDENAQQKTRRLGVIDSDSEDEQ